MTAEVAVADEQDVQQIVAPLTSGPPACSGTEHPPMDKLLTNKYPQSLYSRSGEIFRERLGWAGLGWGTAGVNFISLADAVPGKNRPHGASLLGKVLRR